MAERDAEPAMNQAEPARGSGWSLWLAAILAVGAFIVLLGLGTWQVQRLAWKENLLATIESRIHKQAIPLVDLLAAEGEGAMEFTPVTARGSFVPGKAAFFLATFEGQSGWYVYQPFRLDQALQGRDTLLVNRGFVPYDARASFADGEGVATRTQQIEGLAREMPMEKPSSLLPDNQPADGTFFWKDWVTMAQALNTDTARLVPVFVDLGRPGESQPRDEWPREGVTQVSLPNNHLSYALTWYGLALVLVCVCGMALWRRTHPSADA